MSASSSDLVVDSDKKNMDKAGRRTRLHAFQMELVERMQAARSGLDTRANQLGIMAGDQRYLLNLQDTGEIVTLGALTEVPLTQDWFLGLMNVRGNLISVVDLARFHGLAPTKTDSASRIVCLSSSLMPNGGLLVSRVIGLRNLNDMKMQPDSAESGAPTCFGRRYVDSDSQQWTELKLSEIVQDPNFLHVGI